MNFKRIVQPWKKAAMVFAVAGLAAACEPTLQITTDYNKSLDFSKYKTYRMYQLEQKSRTISQLNAERVIKAIKNEMAKKGFKEVADSPDLIVNAVVVLKDAKYVTANTQYYNQYYGYGGVYRPYGWDATNSTTTYHVEDYVDGALTIDILDGKTSNLIWQSTGNKEIDTQADPDVKIPEAIAKIMAKFPPPPAGAKK